MNLRKPNPTPATRPPRDDENAPIQTNNPCIYLSAEMQTKIFQRARSSVIKFSLLEATINLYTCVNSSSDIAVVHALRACVICILFLYFLCKKNMTLVHMRTVYRVGTIAINWITIMGYTFCLLYGNTDDTLPLQLLFGSTIMQIIIRFYFSHLLWISPLEHVVMETLNMVAKISVVWWCYLYDETSLDTRDTVFISAALFILNLCDVMMYYHVGTPRIRHLARKFKRIDSRSEPVRASPSENSSHPVMKNITRGRNAMNSLITWVRKSVYFFCQRRYREVKRQWVYDQLPSHGDQMKLLSSTRGFVAFCLSVWLLIFYGSKDVYGMILLCFYSMGLLHIFDFATFLYTEPVLILGLSMKRAPFLIETWRHPFLFFMIPCTVFFVRIYLFVSIIQLPIPFMVIQTSVICLVNVIGKFTGGMSLNNVGFVFMGSMTGTCVLIVYECYRRNRVVKEKSRKELELFLEEIYSDVRVRNRQWEEFEIERQRRIQESDIRLSQLWEERRLRLLNRSQSSN